MWVSYKLKLYLTIIYFNVINYIIHFNSRNKVILLVRYGDNLEKILELNNRALFYLNNVSFENKLFDLTSDLSIDLNVIHACIGKNNYTLLSERYKFLNGLSNLDFTDNHLDCYEWHKMAYYFWKNNHKSNSIIHKKFIRKMDYLKNRKLQKTYIFGTGPSLSKVNEMNWDDGYKIVCNTIVRDKATWNYLKPDIIVAADTIYHFGHTGFAKQFRQDLKERLAETKSIFVYPELFQWLVEKEFSGLKDRLFPIPIGNQKKLNINFNKHFELPGLGNVLPLMLLPLAGFLSKNVFMWGFDGRSPRDKLFWKNSKKHSYDELMNELVKAHPAFYEYNVPKESPNKYVDQFQGNELDDLMMVSEKKGWKYTMMHFSWTKTLNKRHLDN